MGKDKNASTALAKIEESPIVQGLAKVTKKLSELKHITESVYKTPGKMPGFVNNLQNETSITELLKMGSQVLGKAHFYTQAQDKLGLQSVPAFKFEGGTVEDWFADIRLRIDIIENKEKMDKLNDVKKQLEGLMDNETRAAMIFAQLENI